MMQTNPYQPPAAPPPPAGDLLGPDFQPRSMDLTFEFGPEQLLAFNLYHFKHSPAIRRQYRIALFLVPLLMAVAAVVMFLSANEKLAMVPAVVAIGIACLLYLLLVPGIYRRIFAWQIRSMMAEGKNAGLFGQHRVSITPTEVRETLSVGDSSRRWSAIERIVETEDYIFIYYNAFEAYVIPKLAFTSELAGQQFLRSARVWTEQATRTTYL